jgi:hypothetical protein
MAFGGMTVGSLATLAVYAMATAPAGLVMGMAWQQAAPSSSAILAFDSSAPLARAQILRGVNGETVSANGSTEAELAALSPAAVLARNYEIAPAAWDRLSAGDCISLTTASGQKLSFRILGAQKGEPARNRPGSSNIDLSVTACAPGSEVILKAVIETRAEGKESAVQRSL